MRRVYIATVQFVIVAKDVDDACDGISAILTDKVAPDPNFLIDWGYLRVGGQHLLPSERFIPDEKDYKEGDFLC